MNGKFHNSGRPSGFQYEKPKNSSRDNNNDYNDIGRNTKDRDDDLIIEDNTVYEIDRECFERLKRQKKRKE